MARRYFGELRDRLRKKVKPSSQPGTPHEWVKVAGMFLHPSEAKDYYWEDPQDYLSNFLNRPGEVEESTHLSAGAQGNPDPFAEDQTVDLEQLTKDKEPVPAATEIVVEVTEDEEYSPKPVEPEENGSLLDELMDASEWNDEAPVVSEDLIDALPEIEEGWQFPHVDELRLEIQAAFKQKGGQVALEDIAISEDISLRLDAYHNAGKKELGTLAFWEEVRAEKERILSALEASQAPEEEAVIEASFEIEEDLPVEEESRETAGEGEEDEKPSTSLFDPTNGTLDIRSGVRTGNSIPRALNDKPRFEVDPPLKEASEFKSDERTLEEAAAMIAADAGDGSRNSYSDPDGSEADASDSLLFSPTFINAITSIAGGDVEHEDNIRKPRKIDKKTSTADAAEETDPRLDGSSGGDPAPAEQVVASNGTDSKKAPPIKKPREMDADSTMIPNLSGDGAKEPLPNKKEASEENQTLGPNTSGSQNKTQQEPVITSKKGASAEESSATPTDLSEEMPVLSSIKVRPDASSRSKTEAAAEQTFVPLKQDQRKASNVSEAAQLPDTHSGNNAGKTLDSGSKSSRPPVDKAGASKPVSTLSESELPHSDPKISLTEEVPKTVQKPAESKPTVDVPVPSGRVTLEQTIEALAFSAEDPVPLRKIGHIFAEAAGVKVPSVKKIESAVARLNDGYEASNTVLRIKIWAEGVRMVTIPEAAGVVRQLYDKQKPKKLSRTLMETLAIVAYSQPTTKPEIDFVRGVDSDYAVRKLLEMGLIDIAGRSDSIGRPLLYGTSDRFLEQFGLSNLEALPKLREIEELLDDPAFSKERLHLLALDEGPSATSESEATSPAAEVKTEEEKPA